MLSICLALMQTPIASHTHNLELGLKTLKLSSEEEPPPSSSCIMTSDMLSPPSPSLMGDYIGMESCFDLKDNEDQIHTAEDDGIEAQSCQRRGKRDQRWERKKKEFPPPIPLLARTGNLPSHMPWVLKRYYTSDGRLIIREEKVRHHEYFRAHRANGRLTLQLVPLDGDDLSPPVASDTEEEEDGYIDADEKADDVECNDDHVEEGDDDVGKEMMHKDQTVMEESTIGAGKGAGKCFEYSSMRSSSSCILGMPLPPIRPVYS